MSIKQAAQNRLQGNPVDNAKRPPVASTVDLFKNVRHTRATEALLKADTALSYSSDADDYAAPGDVILAGLTYFEVAEEDAVDHDWSTDGGLNVYVLGPRVGASAYLVDNLPSARPKPVHIDVPLNSSSEFSATDAANNTAILTQVIDALPQGGSFFVIPQSDIISVYSQPSAITKEINQDYGISRFHWDSAHDDIPDWGSASPSADIQPFMSFIMPVKATFALTTAIAQDVWAFTITAEAAAELEEGDSIYITSDERESYWYLSGDYAVGEANRVLKVDGTTLYVALRTSFAYSTNIVLTQFERRRPTIKGGRFTELDLGTPFIGNFASDSLPDFARFKYCHDFEVSNVEMDRLKLSLVSWSGCGGGLVARNRVPSTQSPSVGGHGNLSKGGGLFSCLVRTEFNEMIRGRHLYDGTRDKNCSSQGNRNVQGVASYTTHGFSSIGYVSRDDTAIGDTSAGWSFGRQDYGPDRDMTVINLTAEGCTEAFSATGSVTGMKIINPTVELDYDRDDASRISTFSGDIQRPTIKGGTVRRTGTATPSVSNMISVTETNASGLFPSRVTVKDMDVQVGDSVDFVRVGNVGGWIDVSGNGFEIMESGVYNALVLASTCDEEIEVFSLGNYDKKTGTGLMIPVDDNTVTGVNYLIQHDYLSRSELEEYNRVPAVQTNLGNLMVTAGSASLAAAAEQDLVVSFVDGDTYTVIASNTEDLSFAKATATYLGGTLAVFTPETSGTDAPSITESGGDLVVANTSASTRTIGWTIRKDR